MAAIITNLHYLAMRENRCKSPFTTLRCLTTVAVATVMEETPMFQEVTLDHKEEEAGVPQIRIGPTTVQTTLAVEDMAETKDSTKEDPRELIWCISK